MVFSRVTNPRMTLHIQKNLKPSIFHIYVFIITSLIPLEIALLLVKYVTTIYIKEYLSTVGIVYFMNNGSIGLSHIDTEYITIGFCNTMAALT